MPGDFIVVKLPRALVRRVDRLRRGQRRSQILAAALDALEATNTE